MMEVEVVARKWGNNLGVAFPSDAVEKEHIQENEHLRLLILKQKNPLKSTFGMMKGKWKQNAQEIKDQIRKDLHGMD